MKKVVFMLVTVALATSFVACKEATKDTPPDPSENDLAIADPATESSTDFLYVTANSGLTLREFDNLNSDKLAVIPYGTKVKVLKAETQPTMTVGGIKGGMDEVEFNHKSGFAFNGYLSKFFPPEEDIRASVYAEELKEHFPNVSFVETTGGTASKPSNTQTLLLPTHKWHEAFYIAKELFEIPNEFAFPNPKGSKNEIVKESKPKSGTWNSQLSVKRNDDQLENILYTYRAEGFGYTVAITQQDEFIKIDRTDLVD